jgi:hypothetical protein
MPAFNTLVRIDTASGNSAELDTAANSTPKSSYAGMFDIAVGTQYVIYNSSRTDQLGTQPRGAYQEVAQTLTDMRDSTSDDEQRIETDVYNLSVDVAAALFDENIPAPSVFSHGPKSVVFNWDDGVHNLYLTVGRARLWAMASTAAGIKGQIELTNPANHIAGNFFKAISPGIAGLLTHITK